MEMSAAAEFEALAALWTREHGCWCGITQDREKKAVPKDDKEHE